MLQDGVDRLVGVCMLRVGHSITTSELDVEMRFLADAAMIKCIYSSEEFLPACIYSFMFWGIIAVDEKTEAE